MHKILKTHRAEADLIDIWRYTSISWGADQAERYLHELDKGISRLVQAPHLGKAIDDVRKGYRALAIGRHLVIYRLDEQVIRIIRVLHERMDPGRQFHEPSDT